jgi:type IV pilus assembly protein PilV
MSKKDNAGFTLLEVMVAMLISLVGLLGLLQSMNVATEHTRKNQLRDEAIQLAEEQLSVMRSRPFDNQFDNFSTLEINSKQSKWKYSVERTRAAVTSTSKSLTVKVTWTYKGAPSSHEIVSIQSQP